MNLSENSFSEINRSDAQRTQ